MLHCSFPLQAIVLDLSGMHRGVEHEGGRVGQGFEPPAECSA